MRRTGQELNLAGLVLIHFECQLQIGQGQHPLRLVGPLGNF